MQSAIYDDQIIVRRKGLIPAMLIATLTVTLSACLPQTSDERVPESLQMTGVPATWSITRGASVRVAILSTGIDRTHPDLPAIVAGRSFIDGDPTDVQDRNGYGTYAAGIIAARHNALGIKSIAPEVQLLVGKVLADNGSGSLASIVEGIHWAISEDADIIVTGFNTSTPNASLQTAVDVANAAGILVVAASGSSGNANLEFPGAYASTLAVGAVDETRNRTTFSNYGETLSVVAPGTRVLTTTLVGTGVFAQAVQGGRKISAYPVLQAHYGEVTGTVFYCGTATGADGNSCPDQVAGQIALIRRGTISMTDKVRHAESKGAVAVIIANNAPGTLEATLTYESPLVAITVTQTEGDALQALNQPTATVTVRSDDYGRYAGTLLSAAHVAGVAALVKSVNPALNNAEIRQILESSAEDIGAVGFDVYTGHGLIDAEAAVNAARVR